MKKAVQAYVSGLTQALAEMMARGDHSEYYFNRVDGSGHQLRKDMVDHVHEKAMQALTLNTEIKSIDPYMDDPEKLCRTECRPFEDLGREIDGYVHIHVLSGIAHKQLGNGLFLRNGVYMRSDMIDMQSSADDELYSFSIDRDWKIYFKDNGGMITINQLPIYQKLQEWGYLTLQ